MKNISPAGPQAGLSNSRRDFLTLGIAAAAAAIGSAALLPLVGIFRKPGKAKRLVFFAALPADDMPEVGIKKAEFNSHGDKDGAPDTRVYLRRDEAGRITAFSALCTHLGCLVNYDGLKREFVCPCHGGRYDTDGNVKSGPPPAPLNRLPAKVERDVIMVGLYLPAD